MNDPRNQLLPERIGEFEIRRLLGSGGSGQVFEAQWGPRRVALKVLRSDLLPTEAERNRFYSEAQILKDLGHAGIVKILSVGSFEDGRPYLVMELLEGESLAKFVTQKSIPFARALDFFQQIAGAVSAIHARGLIHRDLKPENVMVAADRYAVLLDFGIAKSLDAPASTTTQEGGVRGTPAYMAPERFFGQPASVASDVYELAVLLYSITTFSLPWDSGLDPEARLNPIRPSQRGAQIPTELESVLMRALSTRPEARHASVDEFAAAVIAAAGSGAAQARTTAALASGPSAVPSGGAITSGVRSPTQTTPPPQLVTGVHPPKRWPLAVGGLVAGGLIAAAVALAITSSKDDAKPEDSAQSAVEKNDDSTKLAPVAAKEPAKKYKTPTRKGDDSGLAKAAAHHPSDTVVLVGLRGRELRQSKALAKFFNEEKAQDPLATVVRALEPCGIDIVDDLDWMTAGVGSNSSDDFEFTISGAFTRDAVESCIGKVGQSIGAGSKIKRDGEVTEFVDGADVSSLVWINDSTFMLSTRKDADSAWLRARAKGEDSATSKKSLIAQSLAETDLTSTFWLVGRAEKLDVGEELEGIPVPEFLRGTVHISDSFALKGSFDYPDEELAKKGHEALKKKLAVVTDDPMAAGLFEKFDNARDGNSVTIDIRLGSAQTAIVTAAVMSSMRDGFK